MSCILPAPAAVSAPDAPTELLPFRALEQLAPTVAGYMDACRVAQVALPDGRALILTAPQTATKKE